MSLPGHTNSYFWATYVRVLAALGLAVGLLFATPANLWAQDDQNTAGTSTPVSIIEGFHDTLLTVMQNASRMSYAERSAALEGDIHALFDARFMARGATGLSWREFAGPEKAALSKAVADFTLANYAARFNGYSGQSFETLEVQTLKRGMMFVKTQLHKGDGDVVRLNYLMVPNGTGYKIGDVFLDGKYSEIALRRAEFAPILKDGGIDALIAMLQQKVIDLSQEGTS